MAAEQNDQDQRYDDWHKMRTQEWEALCLRCGACCGVVEGDPCEHLRGGKIGEYWCSIYDDRFGLHKTRNGKPFRCVPIREVLHKSWAGDRCCGYKQSR